MEEVEGLARVAQNAHASGVPWWIILLAVFLVTFPALFFRGLSSLNQHKSVVNQAKDLEAGQILKARAAMLAEQNAVFDRLTSENTFLRGLLANAESRNTVTTLDRDHGWNYARAWEELCYVMWRRLRAHEPNIEPLPELEAIKPKPPQG